MKLIDFDLNLLKLLDVLLETRSVTKAAARMGVTQPAASHALGRLRSALRDPLLVRAGAGYSLTDYAEQLREPVRDALERSERILVGPQAVTPATLRREFVLDVADYGQVALLPGLTARLAVEAPSLTVSCRPHENDPQASLERGADGWIGVKPSLPPSLMAQPLLTDTYVSVVRRGHALSRSKKVSLQAFLSHGHLQIAPGGRPGGPLDDVLAAKGLQRVVRVRVPSFTAALSIAVRSDLVLTAPRRVLESFEGRAHLHTFEVPVKVTGFTVHHVWLPRHQHDPAHRWFRQQLKAVAQ